MCALSRHRRRSQERRTTCGRAACQGRAHPGTAGGTPRLHAQVPPAHRRRWRESDGQVAGQDRQRLRSARVRAVPKAADEAGGARATEAEERRSGDTTQEQIGRSPGHPGRSRLPPGVSFPCGSSHSPQNHRCRTRPRGMGLYSRLRNTNSSRHRRPCRRRRHRVLGWRRRKPSVHCQRTSKPSHLRSRLSPATRPRGIRLGAAMFARCRRANELLARFRLHRRHEWSLPALSRPHGVHERMQLRQLQQRFRLPH